MASQVPQQGKDIRESGVCWRATPGAKEALSLKYKQNGWYDMSASTSEEKLVELVLVRIEQSADQFDEFVTMLSGLDQIVKGLNSTGKQT